MEYSLALFNKVKSTIRVNLSVSSKKQCLWEAGGPNLWHYYHLSLVTGKGEKAKMAAVKEVNVHLLWPLLQLVVPQISTDER